MLPVPAVSDGSSEIVSLARGRVVRRGGVHDRHRVLRGVRNDELGRPVRPASPRRQPIVGAPAGVSVGGPRCVRSGGDRAVPGLDRRGAPAAAMVCNRCVGLHRVVHPDVRLHGAGVAGRPEPGVRVPLHDDRRCGPEVPPLRPRLRHQQDGPVRIACRLLHHRVPRGGDRARYRGRFDAQPVSDRRGRHSDRRRLQPRARAGETPRRPSRLRAARDALRGPVRVLGTDGRQLRLERDPAPHGSRACGGDRRARRHLVAGRPPAASGGDVADRRRAVARARAGRRRRVARISDGVKRLSGPASGRAARRHHFDQAAERSAATRRSQVDRRRGIAGRPRDVQRPPDRGASRLAAAFGEGAG